MPMDLPPQALRDPPGYVANAPECRYLTSQDAQIALQRLRARLPSTAFTAAAPSEICGLVRVQLARGTTVYTDPTGRYLLLTFALDTHNGSPADTSEELDRAIDMRQSYPAEGIAGVPAPYVVPNGPSD